MKFKDIFKPKNKLREHWDTHLLYQLTCINEYQSMLADSVINSWHIDEIQRGYIKSYFNFEVPLSLKNAGPYVSSGLLEHVQKRNHDFKRLYELLERSE